MTTELARTVPELLEAHPAVHNIRLVGSRADGKPGPLSDWDFAIDCDSGGAVAIDLPLLLAALKPLAFVPDPLACHVVVAVILPGAIKLDLLFEDAHEIEAAWYASAETLPAIDRHFWDWTLWLGGKQLRGQLELVSSHLSTLSVHLLQPLGVETKPRTLGKRQPLYAGPRGMEPAPSFDDSDRAGRCCSEGFDSARNHTARWLDPAHHPHRLLLHALLRPVVLEAPPRVGE